MKNDNLSKLIKEIKKTLQKLKTEATKSDLSLNNKQHKGDPNQSLKNLIATVLVLLTLALGVSTFTTISREEQERQSEVERVSNTSDYSSHSYTRSSSTSSSSLSSVSSSSALSSSSSTEASSSQETAPSSSSYIETTADEFLTKMDNGTLEFDKTYKFTGSLVNKEDWFPSDDGYYEVYVSAYDTELQDHDYILLDATEWTYNNLKKASEAEFTVKVTKNKDFGDYDLRIVTTSTIK